MNLFQDLINDILLPDSATRVYGLPVLCKLGFSSHKAKHLVSLVERLDSKVDLVSAPIEVQVVSSADAVSHLVGPFFPIFWHENPDKPIADFMSGCTKKLKKDWEIKVTLPEIREKFSERHKIFCEMHGDFPDKFL